jgi:hypothetical protein
MDYDQQAYQDNDFEGKTPEDLELEIAERLNTFASRLSRLAQEQVAKRSQIEQRWLDDIRQYHGQYDAREQSNLEQQGGSKVYVNITRNKTNAAEARLQDMLFPTDDKNWAINPTPVPEIELTQMNNLAEDPAVRTRELEAIAEKQADLMETEIDDQLTESKYQVKARDVIHDACQLGTAILKGPVIIGRSKKRWDTMPDGVSMLQVVEALEPSLERVDPWDFYPDMSARTPDEFEFVFERRRMSKKQLRELAKLPGVMVSQIRELVKSNSKSTHIAKDFIDDIRGITGINTVGEGNKYEIWEYHGPISKSELVDALSLQDDQFDDDEIDELDDEVEAVVFFSGNQVIKVSINPMDSDERPYAVFNWEKDESSVFGFGVPHLMRNPQKLINASWRMMMDNAGLSSADQIVVNKSLISPADGDWRMRPKKVWNMKAQNRSPAEAFASFSTPSHQGELSNIFMMARQLADEETNLPLIAQGESSANTTKTSSGMAMLMNSSNIVLRKAVKNWDDDITGPLIRRFYDWNMQFSDRPEIKGDFAIEARGSGALLVREKQQENLMIYANISMQNPEFFKRRDWDGLDQEIAKSLEVPYESITKSDSEMEDIAEAEAGEGQQDPAMVAAEIQLQLEMSRLQLDQQKAQSNAQIEQQKLQFEQQQVQWKQNFEMLKLEQEGQIKSAEITSKSQFQAAQLEARSQIDLRKDATNRDKAAADTNVKVANVNLKGANIRRGFDTFG